MLRCPWEYCSITSRTSYGFRACWERKEAGSTLRGEYWSNWILISDRPSFCFFIFQSLFACHFATVVVMNKKYAAVVGVNICCGDGAKRFPLLSVRVMSSCYSILSRILALPSVFGKHEPKMDNLSGTLMCSIPWLIPKPSVNHNVRGLNPTDWPNSEHLDPDSNVSEDQRCLVTEILLLEEQGGQMLCISQGTAACGFCLCFFVFRDTFEIRKKGAIQIKKDR